MTALLDALRVHVRALDSALVCFSGGVDSALVLAVAHEQLGDRAAGLTAVSPSLPASEREAAVAFANQIGAVHLVLESAEIDDPRYAANPVNRCYFCKSELYRLAARVAHERGLATVCNGTNADDLGDHRPGLVAADEAAVLSPLVDLGFRKADVRAAANALGLDVWDKPAAACLSSRIPYGTAVTVSRLDRIGRAEQGLRALGLKQLRVRYHDALARVEVGSDEIDRAWAMRGAIVAVCRGAGFTYVTLDLEGYRQGSHNDVVRLPVLGR